MAHWRIFGAHKLRIITIPGSRYNINLLYDAEQFYVKKQDGGWIKISEISSGKSLKEDLSIDTTFDPSYFL